MARAEASASGSGKKSGENHMAGKNRKRIDKAKKAGMQSLDMPKSVWRMIANAATLASAIGASPALAERCRQLAAKAEYLLGEPENRAGGVRADLTREEWEALRELTSRADATPMLKALAEAVDRAVGALDPAEGPALIKTILPGAEYGGRENDDYRLVLQHDHLAMIISCLSEMNLLVNTPSMNHISARMPRLAEIRENTAHTASALGKLKDALENARRAAPEPIFTLALSPIEAFSLHLLADSCLKGIWSDPRENGSDPESKKFVDAKNFFHRLLSAAARFFLRMADMGRDAALAAAEDE